ncbi:histidine--tRNA ligase [PVC group bacterium (ex Bugula neritina AB1)]|nr:histidine--tRNA ligase [PVC group bacterium (ex Bugula neritina AB1)]
MSIKAIRGTKDILPSEVNTWTFIENVARCLFCQYGFDEIRTPIFEKTELFLSGIGEGSDIVQKEMYTFEDPKKNRITLRPEGTAPVIRAFLENHLPQMGALHKLFYLGPMFRYERPQKGRMRQFYQIGAEVLGVKAPLLDVDMMIFVHHFLKELGILNVTLKVNTLGSREDKIAYQNNLKDFLSAKKTHLCKDCQVRYEKNVLRVLDCSNQNCSSIVKEMTPLSEIIGPERREYFETVCLYLDKAGVPYEKDLYLVRGLDYYTDTVFEFLCSSLGAQNAIAAGGRYDNLVQTLGGKETPAFGFACGLERLILSLPEDFNLSQSRTGVYWIFLEDKARQSFFSRVQWMREKGWKAEMSYEDRSLKSQMRYADKNNFEWIFIIGQKELEEGKFQVKNLETHVEMDLREDELSHWLQRFENKDE